MPSMISIILPSVTTTDIASATITERQQPTNRLEFLCQNEQATELTELSPSPALTRRSWNHTMPYFLR